jgi:hypothetical protein
MYFVIMYCTIETAVNQWASGSRRRVKKVLKNGEKNGEKRHKSGIKTVYKQDSRKNMRKTIVTGISL